AFALGYIGGMHGHRFEQLFIDQRLVTQRAEVLREVKRCRTRRSVGQGGQGGVNNLDPKLDRFQAAERSESGSTVSMELHRNSIGVLKDNRHQSLYSLGREQPAGIFEAEAVDFERCGLAGALGKILVGMLR